MTGFSFSPELVERCKRYFSARTGESVSVEEVLGHLEALAGLYEVFVEGGEAAPAALAAETVAPDLITPHSC